MTVPHLGKRHLGAGTAAAPGDTLHFQFGSYNDSGDSELLAGLAVTDIECFKNGDPTARATDSGYSLISDTGMIGNRVGLYRFRLQLYNTADDTGFFDQGSWYQVAVDSVTIDGKTVRLWVGSFEIGTQRADVRQIAGDTGAAIHLQQSADASPRLLSDIRAVLNDTGAAHLDQGRFGVLSDSGRMAAVLDTGKVASAVWTSHATRTLTAFAFDTGIWGSNFAGGRTLTSFGFDTGVADAVWKYVDTGARTVNVRKVMGDTGAANQLQQAFATTPTYLQRVDLRAVLADTGAAHLDAGRLGVSAAATVDTGLVNNAIWNAARADHVAAGTFGQYVLADLQLVEGDTGASTRFFRFLEKLDTGGDIVVSAAVDTGLVNNAVWNGTRAAHTTAGTFGEYTGANIRAVLGDTGAAHLDQGRFGVISDSGRMAAVLDTGKVAAAVWTSHATRTLTAFAFDTGIWGSNFAGGRTLTSFNLDTGVADTVWKYGDTGLRSVNMRSLFGDTGAAVHLRQAASASPNLLSDIRAVLGDTGAAHLDQGRFGVISDSGRMAAVLDTGKVASAVWTSHATRTLTAFAFDTGIWGSNFSGGRTLTAISDTGLNERLTAIEERTGRLQFDTGNWVQADIRKTNNVRVVGTGDTGTGDTWRAGT